MSTTKKLIQVYKIEANRSKEMNGSVSKLVDSITRNLSAILIISLSIVLSSCEQDAEVDPPKFVMKPVITCLMTPKSNFVEAKLNYTRPYYGDQTNSTVEHITDAVLVLEDLNLGSKDTFSHTGMGLYQLLLKNVMLISNHKYELRVIMKDGQVHKAQSTVPPPADFANLTVNYATQGKEYEETDPWGGPTYTVHPVTIEFSYKGLNQGFYVSPQLEGAAKNLLGQEAQFELYFNEETQEGLGNKPIVFFNRTYFYSGFGLNGPFKLSELRGTIYTMDKAYRDLYLVQWQDDENPFQEPILYNSNFSEGAIGVFGSYDFSTGSVELK